VLKKCLVWILVSSIFLGIYSSWIFGAEKKELKLFLLDDGPEYQRAWKQIIERYEKRNPNITITPIYGGWSQGHEKLLVSIAGGVPPDITQFNDDFIGDYTYKGILEPLNELLKDVDWSIFFKAGVEVTRINGIYRSAEIAHKPRLFYYNKDLFDKAGVSYPPKTWPGANWTWDTFLEKAKKLTKDTNGDGVPDIYGTEIGLAGQAPFWWIRNNAPEPYNIVTEGKFSMIEPWAIEALQWCADLSLVHKVNPPFSLEMDVGGRNLFLSQKAAMFFSGSWELPFLRDAKFRWDVAPIPKKVRATTEASGFNFGIISTSKNKKEAADFLKYLLTAVEPQAILGKETGLAPAKIRESRKLQWLGLPQNISINKGLFIDSLLNTVYGPFQVPGWYEAYKYLKVASDEVAAGKKTAKQAMEEITPKCQAALDQYKK